jgi:hypothetical protein
VGEDEARARTGREDAFFHFAVAGFVPAIHAAATTHQAVRGGPTVNDKTAAKSAEKKFIYQVNADWLALRREEPIAPNLPIIDPHHHLWDRGLRYLFDELKDDVDSSGHNIRATVYLQCGSMYRAEGDPKFAPVGETEFVNGVAAMSASDLYGPARLCGGIVGFADLLLGAAVDAVLEAHLRVAGERFKGVRRPCQAA